MYVCMACVREGDVKNCNIYVVAKDEPRGWLTLNNR